MPHMHSLRFAQYGIRLLPMAVLLFLLYTDVVPSGQAVYIKHFGKPSPFVSEFWPAERTGTLTPDNERPLLQEAVYFDVRPPRPFQQIKVSLQYTKQGIAPVILGAQVGPDLSQFERKPLIESHMDDRTVGYTFFNMNELFRDRLGKYHLVVESGTDAKLVVQEIRVELTKEKITLQNIGATLGRWLRRHL